MYSHKQGCISTIIRTFSDHTDLKDVLANKVPYEQERVKKFRKEQGNVKIGEITVDMVLTLQLVEFKEIYMISIVDRLTEACVV